MAVQILQIPLSRERKKERKTMILFKKKKKYRRSLNFRVWCVEGLNHGRWMFVVQNKINERGKNGYRKRFGRKGYVHAIVESIVTCRVEPKCLTDTLLRQLNFKGMAGVFFLGGLSPRYSSNLCLSMNIGVHIWGTRFSTGGVCAIARR